MKLDTLVSVRYILCMTCWVYVPKDVFFFYLPYYIIFQTVLHQFCHKAILFFFSVYRRPTDPNFWHFLKKSNDIVTPFFT